jgi:putative transposase
VLRAGEQASPELVRALMVSADLVACQPRPFRTTTTADPAAAADHLGRDFTAEAPGVKLVGDITYIPTWEGWLYLGTVIDCFSKRVVGWSMADHMRTSLVCDAIDMAAGNIELAEAVYFILIVVHNTPVISSTSTWTVTESPVRWAARGCVGR